MEWTIENASKTDIEPFVSLGTKLRERRRALGLTLQNVAQKAKLTAGFISQIERDLTTPSLSSLHAVAEVLDVSVRDLLSQPESTGPLTRQNQRELYAVGDKALQYERLSANFKNHVLRSVIVHEPPGHRTEMVTHEGEELILVLKGELSIMLDGTHHILKSGDSLHFPSTAAHSMWNHTNADSTIHWVGTMDIFSENNNRPDPTHRHTGKGL